ncbi:MAG: trypsin-like peptidase domain-containing protein [Candidatus Gastranaerophilales bacterium]|nr:trypsin-like peptidase domain-containing protein [Candidatus Gastranaerophilales bacterium]
MKKLIISVIVSFLLGFGSAEALSYSQDEAINVAVYEKVNPSIVFIEAISGNEVSTGTGIVVGKNGEILTSAHVIDEKSTIEVKTSKGEVYKGSILYKPKNKSDLMLIKISAKKQLPVIKLGDSSVLKVGQKVLAIGNPFGFSGTLTTGIISRIDYEKNKIQTDAAINPGSSGGPIVNAEGEVIGISQSIYNPDNNRSNIGIGFAIPVNDVKKLLTDYGRIKI